MKPPFRRRATIGAQLASLLWFFWFVALLLFVALANGCAARSQDRDVFRVRGVQCPAGTRFLFTQERFSDGSARLYSWCRDTTRGAQ